MKNNLTDDVLEVCNILNKHKVEFLIVGGTAVAFHGYYRPSINSIGNITEKPDLDFWYNPNYENYFHLLNALEELGQDVTVFKNEQSPNPHQSFFKFEFRNFTLDFLPRLKAELKFRNSYKMRETIALKGIEFPFLSINDLITDKETNARTKDQIDLEHLKIIRESSK